MRGGAFQVLPIVGDAHRTEIEVLGRQRMEIEQAPVADENQRRRGKFA